MKKFLNRLFIDGLSGMALGLFSTLIVGTILCQIGKLCGTGIIAAYITGMGNAAKSVTGAGIGIGVAAKLKSAPLTCVAAAVAGFVGAFPGIVLNNAAAVSLGAPGEPLGAFVAAYIAVEIGALVAGKTKIDILLTPLACVISGSVVGLLIGPYISAAMLWLGNLVNINVDKSPILGGIAVSVLMGMILTLPISSAAIGISMGLSGLAAGAAAVGCCCNMVGFAAISYRENRVGGLLAQGLGTSMLQVPNIVKNPLIWLPAIISSAVLGPISSALLKMVNSPVGSGMGSAGLVGQIAGFDAMVSGGTSPVIAVIEIAVMHFIAPAALSLAIAEAMRKLNLIKKNDLLITNVTK